MRFETRSVKCVMAVRPDNARPGLPACVIHQVPETNGALTWLWNDGDGGNDGNAENDGFGFWQRQRGSRSENRLQLRHAHAQQLFFDGISVTKRGSI